ncbi:MAG: MOSC domain-containing protein [Candidatus Eisenbacteria bacterium]|uniref:MOSC domain-containing protein n=1 Tax=Eiseniibacteriota bacterium TaxID=2212470 RepID=A0A956LWX3_UNCEI|nr:MOSC domain-containing protein [Candidatus Eisenbacteria bacterium]
MFQVGRVHEIVRYPVKSMAGIRVPSANLGWHGLDGDRRFAFRRVGNQSGNPWLSASALPELLRYHPVGNDESPGEPIPTLVRTPSGVDRAVGSPELDAEISELYGSPVELTRLSHGIFDEAAISVISLTTIAGIGREAGGELDRRRFRANIVVETERADPFLEDDWVGGMLVFGEGDSGPAVAVTLRDLRCMMVNLDPDSAHQDPRVMKAVVRLNGNYAGVYGAVVRTGPVRPGDRVHLVPAPPLAP